MAYEALGAMRAEWVQSIEAAYAQQYPNLTQLVERLSLRSQSDDGAKPFQDLAASSQRVFEAERVFF